MIDERFLMHRLRSTSYAGMAGAVVCAGILFYRFATTHRWDFGLFAVLGTLALVKVALMIWYHVKD